LTYFVFFEVPYRQILFDLNGSDKSDNAVVTVTFDDGTVLSDQLPDFAQTSDDVYTFSQSTTTLEYTSQNYSTGGDFGYTAIQIVDVDQERR
jgi:hypothetical protein